MSLEKICNLYASDYHFCTTLFPFIKKNMEEGKEVINIFENDLEKNIKTMLERMKIEKEFKEYLLKIEWNKEENINFEKELENFANGNEKIIFINGSPRYIELMNENIENWINKNELDQNNIKIIHCYNIEEINNEIKNITNSYHKILNTTGEHTIKQIYSYN